MKGSIQLLQKSSSTISISTLPRTHWELLGQGGLFFFVIGIGFDCSKPGLCRMTDRSVYGKPRRGIWLGEVAVFIARQCPKLSQKSWEGEMLLAEDNEGWKRFIKHVQMQFIRSRVGRHILRLVQNQGGVMVSCMSRQYHETMLCSCPSLIRGFLFMFYLTRIQSSFYYSSFLNPFNIFEQIEPVSNYEEK